MDDNFIDDLILNGGLEVAGVDPTSGEILYNFTNKLKDVDPDLYNTYMDFVHQSIMGLWEKGYINMDPSSDNPELSLTDKAIEYFGLNTDDLSPIEAAHFEEIVKRLTEQ